jgi:hypothetical protein
METAIEEKAVYRTINEKMGETVSLSVEKLHLSEYNTRSTCIDMKHVDNLAGKIKERGFHPKRAISVNVIRGVGGGETTYRVTAGIHRLEAARKAGLSELPCLLYYDLTEEEECLLDKWDNEMDEDHKKIHFLEEAEHYKYLQKIKGWSQRQLSRNKSVNKGTVFYRLQIANIPEEAKKIIKGVPNRLGTFHEKYFQYICKLKDPHIITICEEIAARGRLAEKEVKEKKKHPVQPMRQSDIEKRVEELLKKEKEGKIDIAVKVPIPAQLELFSHDGEEEMPDQENTEENYTIKTVTTQIEDGIKEEVAWEAMKEPPQKPTQTLAIEMTYRNPEKKTRGLNLDRCVRWLKNAGLFETLGQTAYIALRKIEEYDLWYRGNTDEPFFLTGEPFALIAKQSGVEKEHIQKRVMPYLKKEKFLDYWQDTKGRNGIWWFALNWDRLFEVYCERAYTIPFNEDGLKDIPSDFTGVVRPTPFHYIRIEKGMVVPWGKEAPTEDIPERTYDDLLRDELRRLKPSMSEKDIAECLENRSEAEIALKLFSEMDPKKKSGITNESGYVRGILKKGPGIPQGFITPQEARRLEETDKKLEAFLNTFKEGSFKYFCPKETMMYEIVTRVDHGFTILKDDGDITYCSFKDWMDVKYFR